MRTTHTWPGTFAAAALAIAAAGCTRATIGDAAERGDDPGDPDGGVGDGPDAGEVPADAAPLAAAAPASCDALRDAAPGAPSGVYALDPDGPGAGAAFDAYCEMDADGGGWTLAMKLDGAAATFRYESAQWTDATPYQPAEPDLDLVEAKLASYATMPFTALRLGMVDGGTTRWITVELAGTSLRDVLAAGDVVPTDAGRAGWSSLVATASLQAFCDREGTNLALPFAGTTLAQARIGITTNNEDDCTSNDSFLGFGTSNLYWEMYQATTPIACGNQNGEAAVAHATFGYLMLR